MKDDKRNISIFVMKKLLLNKRTSFSSGIKKTFYTWICAKLSLYLIIVENKTTIYAANLSLSITGAFSITNDTQKKYTLRRKYKCRQFSSALYTGPRITFQLFCISY